MPAGKPGRKAGAGRGRGAWWPRARVPTPHNRRARPRAQDTTSGGSSVGGISSWCSLIIHAVRRCGVDVDDADKRGSERAPPAKRLQGELTRGRGREGRRYGSAQRNPCGKIPAE
ncbi:hypothetical protein FB451DRAFT_1185394 [Mycena latifolia]|nr:hypothetical protein FB451DRAFT_1185394 [Mycena latifolia]